MIGRFALAGSSLALASAVHATAPRCTSGPPAVHAAIPLGGSSVVARVAIAIDGDRLVVAARVLPLRRERHGETRIVMGTLDATGWLADPAVLTTWPGRVDGDLALAVHAGTAHLLAAGPMGARALAVASPAVDLAPPAHAAQRTPVIAALDDRFTVVWPMAHGARVQFLPFDAATPTDTTAIELPRRTLVVRAAAGPGGRTGIVVRTSSRRYWTAVIDGDGALHWPRTAPAGCERNACPEVWLHRGDDGWVATWRGRPTEGDLRAPSGIALDREGRLLGHAETFVPMVHGVGLAGPHGAPFAVQLGRPSVLRGGVHPIALDGTEGDPRAMPTLVAGVTDGDALTVVTARPDGTLVASHAVCTVDPP